MILMKFGPRCLVGCSDQSVSNTHLFDDDWLILLVVLQGYMYLTNSYLCFFAHMPTREVRDKCNL